MELKWLKLQQKTPRFEIRNDSVIPSKEIKRHKEGKKLWNSS